MLPTANGHLFICPLHGQMDGVVPWGVFQIINREHKCGLCKKRIGRRVNDERGMQVVNQIIADSIRAYI